MSPSPLRRESSLPPCQRCDGTGEVAFNNGPRYAGGRDPQRDDYATCPDCKGDGTQIRADLELLADLAAMPGVGRGAQGDPLLTVEEAIRP